MVAVCANASDHATRITASQDLGDMKPPRTQEQLVHALLFTGVLPTICHPDTAAAPTTTVQALTAHFTPNPVDMNANKV